MNDPLREPVTLDLTHRFFGVHVPFLAWLDVRSIRIVPGEAELELDLRPELLNRLAAAHGGVICTLVDIAMAAAARSDNPDSRVVTVDMSVQFLHPGSGTLKAIGRARKVTRSLAFCEAEVVDQTGELVARGTGVFKRLKPGRGDGDG